MNFIPTSYNGHIFRSLMEARWAVFFDYFGFCWDYEPHGLISGDSKYLPDFYLKDFNVYVEVKYKNDPDALILTRKFAIDHNIDIIICDGNPHVRPLLLYSGSINNDSLGFESKILWFYKKGEGLKYEATESSTKSEYASAVIKANNQRFGVLEIKNMLGQARKKESNKLKCELLSLRDKYNIDQKEITNIVESIVEFNQTTCLRALYDACKNKIDNLSIDQMELLNNFDYNKGLKI